MDNIDILNTGGGEISLPITNKANTSIEVDSKWFHISLLNEDMIFDHMIKDSNATTLFFKEEFLQFASDYETFSTEEEFFDIIINDFSTFLTIANDYISLSEANQTQFAFYLVLILAKLIDMGTSTTTETYLPLQIPSKEINDALSSILIYHIDLDAIDIKDYKPSTDVFVFIPSNYQGSYTPGKYSNDVPYNVEKVLIKPSVASADMVITLSQMIFMTSIRCIIRLSNGQSFEATSISTEQNLGDSGFKVVCNFSTGVAESLYNGREDGICEFDIKIYAKGNES